jgi:hypothetical protein
MFSETHTDGESDARLIVTDTRGVAVRHEMRPCDSPGGVLTAPRRNTKMNTEPSTVRTTHGSSTAKATFGVMPSFRAAGAGEGAVVGLGEGAGGGAGAAVGASGTHDCKSRRSFQLIWL